MPLVQVDGQDRQHVEAGELVRVGDGVARREVAPERAAAEVALEHGAPEELAELGVLDGVVDGLALGGDDRLRHGVDHEPRDGAVLARVDEAARDLHRARDRRRAETSISVTIVVLESGASFGANGAAGRHARRARALVGDHQHAVAAQQQPVLVAVERERARSPRRRARSRAACCR